MKKRLKKGLVFMAALMMDITMDTILFTKEVLQKQQNATYVKKDPHQQLHKLKKCVKEAILHNLILKVDT